MKNPKHFVSFEPTTTPSLLVACGIYFKKWEKDRFTKTARLTECKNCIRTMKKLGRDMKGK